VVRRRGVARNWDGLVPGATSHTGASLLPSPTGIRHSVGFPQRGAIRSWRWINRRDRSDSQLFVNDTEGTSSLVPAALTHIKRPFDDLDRFCKSIRNHEATGWAT